MECDVNGCAESGAKTRVLLPGHGDQPSHEEDAVLCTVHQAQYDEFGFVSGLTIPDDRVQYTKNNTLA